MLRAVIYEKGKLVYKLLPGGSSSRPIVVRAFPREIVVVNTRMERREERRERCALCISVTCLACDSAFWRRK